MYTQMCQSTGSAALESTDNITGNLEECSDQAAFPSQSFINRNSQIETHLANILATMGQKVSAYIVLFLKMPASPPNDSLLEIHERLDKVEKVEKAELVTESMQVS